MKKFLSVSLSILMILCFVFSATPVYATDGSESNATLSEADQAAVAAGTPFRLNDGDNATYKATFKAAYDLAAAGDTIYLLADATVTEQEIVIDKNLSLKGIGNVTLTNNTDNNKFWISALTATLNVEDINLVIGCGGITVSNGGTLNMKNVTAKALRRAVFKLSNTTGTSTATITDCALSFEGTGQKQNVILLEQAGNHVLNLEGNTTVTRTSALDSWGANGHTSYNNGVICIFYNSTGKSTINVGSNAKIIGKHGAANANTDIPSLIVYMNDSNSGAGTLEVNLEAGSELAFDRINDGMNKNTYFNLLGDTTNVKIVDKGCNFTATADSLKAGVVLPTGTVNAATEGGPLAGYKLGEIALESNEYVNAEATEAATFKAYFNIYIAPGINPALTSQADVDAVKAGKYFRNDNAEGVYFETFGAALSASADGDTIYLLDNASYSEQSLTVNKNITLKGIGDVTLTNTASNKTFWINPLSATLNIEDMNLVIGCGGITVSDGGTLNLKNVEAHGKFRAIFKLSSVTGTATATVTDSTLIFDGSSQQQNAIILESTGTHVLNLEGNTVIERTSALSGWCAYDDGVIAVWYNASNSVNTINVGKNVKIIGKHGADNASKDNTPSLIVYCNGGLSGSNETAAGKLTVNLAEGSTLEFDRANDGKNKNVFINLIGDTSKVTINDNGCIYKANADSLKAGVVLPSCVTDGNGGKPLGFYMNGANPTFALEYVNAEATESVEFTPFFFNADGFKLIDGASIRLEKPYGIRFSAQVSAELYNTLKALDENVEFGMILAPTRKVFDGFNPDEMADRDKAIIVCNKWAVENVDGIYGYHGAIYISDDQLLANADEATFEAKISAMAYVKFTVNGETRIIYTEYDPAVNSVSILDVAQGYYNDTVNGSTENAIVNYIIETCKDN